MIREEKILNIAMAEGDYNVYLPIYFVFADSSQSIAETDSVTITIAKIYNVNGMEAQETLLEKTFTGITNNTLNLFFTEEESNMLPKGQYRYSLDWWRDGEFMCNLIERQIFSVRDKVSLEDEDES